MDLEAFRQQAQSQRKANRKFLQKLKLKPPRDLDEQVMALDQEVFEEIDCLSCANCCSTLSPIFTPKDVERLAHRLRLKPGEFMERYLRTDEEGDMVLQSSPCPFLGPDHYCAVYEDRPKACREYPHTGQRKFHTRISLTMKNMMCCPAAWQVVERLKAQMD